MTERAPSTMSQANDSALRLPEEPLVRAVSVPLSVDRVWATETRCEPIRMGIPFPRASLTCLERGALVDEQGRRSAVQLAVTSRWSDGSVRWLLADLLAPPGREGRHTWTLELNGEETAPRARLGIEESPEAILVDTGPLQFRIGCKEFGPLASVQSSAGELLGPEGSWTRLTDRKGRERSARVEHACVETAGPLCATIRLTGRFDRCAGLRFRARLSFYAGTGLVCVRFTLHNCRSARHRGGLWDLGDPGSFFFRDLSIGLEMAAGRALRTFWKAEVDHRFSPADGKLEIYQDSSGGENWQSRNHANRWGRVPCRFAGYRVRSDRGEQSGRRASPSLRMENGAASIGICLPEFWQQFPKAVEAEGSRPCVRLFPQQWDDLFELQGGERKTHTVWLHFAGVEEASTDALEWVHRPCRVLASRAWYASSGAFSHLLPADEDVDARMAKLMAQAIRGPRSVFAGRERIDEYGWRNYGDVWANHEEAYYEGPKPVISHYNNQFDIVEGAILQWLRTGDPRWFDVFDPLARHVMDIDIYHTDRDRAAYNGGLFWFTDHYLDARTSSHRTYARGNRPADGRPYGGGPGSEHNYATGLMHYGLLTGDPDAREAVLGLADWVIRMDDGSRNVLGAVAPRPTGLPSVWGGTQASGPGRAGANSVKVLLDAWELSGQRSYLAKAEELIRRCIHPADDVAARNLLDAERHWSYTMFLSALARYLEVKASGEEIDDAYAYARQSLLHYASWMLDRECPYLERAEKLEYPTETWAAQEFRKANVLRLAALHAEPEFAERLLGRAAQLADRAWNDLLQFDSATAARPLAVVMVEGSRDAFFRARRIRPAPLGTETARFGAPELFVSQRAWVRAQCRTPAGWLRLGLRLMCPASWRRVMHALRAGVGR